MVEIETFPLFVDCLLHCRGSNGYQHLIELFFSFLFVQVPSYSVETMTISNSTICLILKRGNMLTAAEAAEHLNLRKTRSLCSSICEHGQLFGRPPLAIWLLKDLIPVINQLTWKTWSQIQLSKTSLNLDSIIRWLENTTGGCIGWIYGFPSGRL